MDKKIVELEKKEQTLLKEAKKYSMAIQALRAVCDHDFQLSGHGHNYSLYTCAHCGETYED